VTGVAVYIIIGLGLSTVGGLLGSIVIFGVNVQVDLGYMVEGDVNLSVDSK